MQIKKKRLHDRGHGQPSHSSQKEHSVKKQDELEQCLKFWEPFKETIRI